MSTRKDVYSRVGEKFGFTFRKSSVSTNRRLPQMVKMAPEVRAWTVAQ